MDKDVYNKDLEIRIASLEEIEKKRMDEAEKAFRDEKYRLSMLGHENMRWDFSDYMYLLPTDENNNDIRLQQVAKNFWMMIDKWGIHPDFIKCFPNVINNNSFEWYDHTTKVPLFWTGDGVVTDWAAFDGTYSLKLLPGQTMEQGTLDPIYPGLEAGSDPAWWNNYQTRCSFRHKGGAVRVRVKTYGDISEHLTEVPVGWIGVYNATDLDNVRNNLTANYIQMADIDLVGMSNLSPLSGADVGWMPIAKHVTKGSWESLPFTGAYNGNGYIISNLYINWTNESYYPPYGELGLFSVLYGNATITNVCIKNAKIKAHAVSTIGLLAGASWGGTVLIENCNAEGSIESPSCFEVGGLIGTAYGPGSTIRKCFAIVAISHANSEYVGGFIGYSYDSIIENCYARGSISQIDSDFGAGGFTGQKYWGRIENCYSAVSMQIISGTAYGGFAGYDFGGGEEIIVSCYYDSDVSGMADTGKGEPRTTAEMTYPYSDPENVYIKWAFDDIWQHDTNRSVNDGYPHFNKISGFYLLTDNSEEGLINKYGQEIGVIRSGYYLDYPYIENWASFVDGSTPSGDVKCLITGYRTFYFTPIVGIGKVKFCFENIDLVNPVYIDMVQMAPDFTGKWGMFETLGKRSIAPGDVIGMPGLGVPSVDAETGELKLQPNPHDHDDKYLNKANIEEYIPAEDYHPATKKYVDDYDHDHDHDDNYLSKINIEEYIPTEDYHPATVKFVKDNTGTESLTIHQTVEIMSRGGLDESAPVKTVVGTVMGWKMAKDTEFYISERSAN